ncbi:enoyl-[acyl-carrier-protein] reductase FabI [Rathayibacter rathayi]|uniref:enoyl-ACP reductase FabI n=1 Tax=Rathayibacter rathayi TaxID=33887 RepID=UPI000CE756E2|nr:enoyl-ACP reductase FabI [Rathayibacter rathayi]PPG65140.1 enoyl-[acyl-carrier-protein] reductase FabI [Rathayibacter rathayi]PPG74180.1 enoyl-[acyl-carrier-protein] reductase FabI [Rathayibacter rathayi]PPG88738.1 enoyl-[acyl-carrier-protein] reductase FabI [Rathayibacter rathayi]PPG96930.1 enoyl-[acyl-carrier-protein] reductase FabI [Rathayibacter rathayi]PPH16904.1 enoyl-[acyl-carrier-protein] reductase FabI [Rathayibacter rathayi]
MSALLAGRTFLVAGLWTDRSLAFPTAAAIQQHGGRVLCTAYGKQLRAATTIARRLPQPAAVLEFDATESGHPEALTAALREQTDELHGVVHFISGSYPSVVGGHFLEAPWADVSHSFQVSAYSLQSLVRAALPLMGSGSSVVGCTFDASVAWPIYGWAGPAKAAYEATNRYLALHLGPHGIRSNLIAAGPVQTMTMRAIEGIDEVGEVWNRAPLRWDDTDPAPVADATVALLSDLLRATTGSIIHVDGGFHAVGY